VAARQAAGSMPHQDGLPVGQASGMRQMRTTRPVRLSVVRVEDNGKRQVYDAA